MKLNITITSPTLEDIDTLYEWGENNWQLWFSENDLKDKCYSKDHYQKWINNTHGDILLIAKIGNVPVGMCLTFSLYTYALIDLLFVEEKYRFHGIGKMLLEKTKELLKRQGIYEIGLYVNSKNQSAMEFYKHYGLKLGNQLYWMEKELEEK